MTLRLRLGLAAAGAVAVAVSAVTVASWLFTRQQLADQLDSNLQSVQAQRGYVEWLLSLCGSEMPEDTGQRNETPTPYVVQVITADGTVCADPGNKEVEVDESDLAVARGVLTSALHDAASDGGQRMRVSTTRPTMRRELSGQYAVSIAQSLSAVDKPLDSLALFLLGFAGVGVLGAATAGVGISRAGLRPVEDLTDAAEHIARTQDLTVRIPADGNDEIARLSKSFNDMTEALATSRERQQQLIADAGHELRTPLTSLRANIQLLIRSHSSGREIPATAMHELLRSVESQVGELATLIADLQELSRPDVTPHETSLHVVALHEVARRAMERVKLRGNELEFNSDLDEWYVLSEHSALERAVVNLLDNAVKFSPAGGTVSLRLSDGQLVVRDQGPGIAADELPHVFDRFWRSPTARSLPGSGLGLAIVAKTVQQAGGTVALRPAGSQGTEAVVRIPGTRKPPSASEPACAGPVAGA
ncbi:sensor histidine kinase [Streptomyces brasiliensis]|uniref:histidine kinase n=1 Tax=Streptomyces brasiliensis TaxID=1954 RepID=A0A917LAH7_9ACTN|nr:HAMP domain-containing sensor histidine kinase [Streptomyces brasiliensis]GGJ51880.1 two-component sensor histidine kinase [Streptomyces brasiliensis]